MLFNLPGLAEKVMHATELLVVIDLELPKR
jgi:hypothetical protein